MFTINLHDVDSSFSEDLNFNGFSSTGLEMSIGHWLTRNNPEKEAATMEKLKEKFAEIQLQQAENASELQRAFVDEQMAKADRMAKEVGTDPAQNEAITEKLGRRVL